MEEVGEATLGQGEAHLLETEIGTVTIAEGHVISAVWGLKEWLSRPTCQLLSGLLT